MKFLKETLIALVAAIILLANPLIVFGAEGDVLFSDDFNDGNFSGWDIASGIWAVEDGNLLANQTGQALRGQINTDDNQWDNYAVEFDVNNQNGIDEGIGVRHIPGANIYELNLRHGKGAFNTPQLILRKVQDGIVTTVADVKPSSLENNKWYHVRVEVVNENIRVFIDNVKLIDKIDSGTKVKKGGILLSSWTGDVGVITVRFDNVKVISLGGSAIIPPPEPFLDLPWDYGGKGLPFNEAANRINSYFDHEYPLLSSGSSEPNDATQIVNFRGFPKKDLPYSSHDGYDYGIPAKVILGDPVLATADGCALYMQIANPDDPQNPNNVIKIDHGNSYQTRYLHLKYDEYLITKSTTNCVPVTKGQRIGTVWYSGRVIPSGPGGAHIHFMVIQDKNKDGNFDDNIPDGVTDPFGWQSKEIDPWENYTFFYNGQNRSGNRSYYLWTKKLDNLDSTLTSNEGVFQISRATINFPAGSTNQNLNINLQSSPMVKVNNVLSSIGSTIVATAKDALGNLVTDFQNFFSITIDFNGFDLSRYKTDTLSIYSSPDNINWTKETTTINWTEKTASAQLNHFTHFALMAERADITPPITSSILSGQQGQAGWFRSDVQVTLEAEDNAGGLGVDYTLYRINNGEWQQYTAPFSVTDEGHYKLEAFSADNDENIEEVKTLEFDIDKTYPQASIDANPKTLWPPDGKMVDITVTGNSSDTHLYSTNITVDDEYNQIEPTFIIIGSDINQTIPLEARRDGSDLNGRMYIIKIIAEDLAGNKTESQVEVKVPHDQRING